MLLRSGDTTSVFLADLCDQSGTTLLYAGDAGALTRSPFLVTDSLVLFVEHSQERGHLLYLGAEQSREIWFPSRYDPDAPVRQIIGGVVNGRIAWRVNALRDSIPPMPPFAHPWVLGDSLLKAEKRIPDLRLPLSAEVRAVSRGDFLWTITNERHLTRTQVSGTLVQQIGPLESPVRITILHAAPDGALWLGGATAPNQPTVWVLLRPDESAFAGCIRTSARVVAAPSKDELLVERQSPSGLRMLEVIRVKPTSADC